MKADLAAGTIVGRRVGTCEMCQYQQRNLLEHVNYWTSQAKHRNKIEAYCLDCYRSLFAENEQLATWATVRSVVA